MELAARVITVLLVDQSDALRRALRAYLTLAPDVQLVGEASDVVRALALIEKLRPHVVILDAEMRSLDVRATARAVQARTPSTRVVVHALNPHALADDTSLRVIGKHEGVEALLAAVRA
jgi:DNA-binding NarL/FixJ family response regulator